MGRRRKAFLKKHELQVAGKKRKCKHSGDAIAKGEACLVVWDSQYDKHTYSQKVALEMIRDARAALHQLESQLE